MRIIIFVTSIFLFNTFSIAQTPDSSATLDYANPQTYEIGGIAVKGLISSQAKAIIAVSGLKIGERISVPGLRIQQALEAVWKLGVFEDVQIKKEKVVKDILFLEIEVVEQIVYAGTRFIGVKKRDQEELKKQIQSFLRKGRTVSEQDLKTARETISAFYIKKGYLNTTNSVAVERGEEDNRKAYFIFRVERGERVKIAAIHFSGNELFSQKKLLKTMEHTRLKSRLFSKSVFQQEFYELDKKAILALYQEKGYLDAAITHDSVFRNAEGDLVIDIQLSEGEQYFFGEISWKGNTLYTDEELNYILGIKTGAVFNTVLLERRLHFDEPKKDVSSLYLDRGYLFFKLDPVIYAVTGNQMHLEIRISEGRQATINKVTIKGNDRTDDEVIRRELRTLPGAKFSREDIIRSQREIVNLGFFNPEGLRVNTPVNAAEGTVDIEYIVEEKSNDQFELSAGWGGPDAGVVGSLGLSFNNFSLRNLLNFGSWSPVPSGEGQRLGLRLQSSGKAYQSANFSFTEPWLGKKKPNTLSIAGFFNRYTSDPVEENGSRGVFTLSGFTASLGTRLTWPDDYFVATTSVNLQRLYLKEYDQTLFTTDQGLAIVSGQFFNFSLTQTIARNSLNHPIFPTRGSSFSLSVQLTPPYSLFSDKDYSNASPQDRFRWLEYHKWQFKAEHHRPLTKRLSLKFASKMGYIGSYNSSVGLSPFERFQLGGSGTAGQTVGFQGTDLIALRGYEVSDLEANYLNGNIVAAPLYQKFSVELRYPLLNNPNIPVIGLLFAEAGNSWRELSDYNPFELKRSVGFGLRTQVPMFGMLGFDYGFGLDKGIDNFWKTGKISIILGFEPD